MFFLIKGIIFIATNCNDIFDSNRANFYLDARSTLTLRFVYTLVVILSIICLFINFNCLVLNNISVYFLTLNFSKMYFLHVLQNVLKSIVR